MKVKIGYKIAVLNSTLKDSWNIDKYLTGNRKILWLCYNEKALKKLFQESFKRGGKKRAIKVVNSLNKELLQNISDGKFTGEVEISA